MLSSGAGRPLQRDAEVEGQVRLQVVVRLPPAGEIACGAIWTMFVEASVWIYRIEHEKIGTFDLFLVPIGPDEEGLRYEAVFT